MIFFTIQANPLPTQSYGPTYPEIWGYDLSEIPAVKWGGSSMEAYAMDDGDIWFLTNYSYNEKNSLTAKYSVTDEKYLLIKFFKGEQLVLSQKEREKLFELTEKKDISPIFFNNDSLHFSDGSKLRMEHGSTAKLCYVPQLFRNYFVKTDSEGKEKKYSILVATPQVEMHTDRALCEAPGAPFLYEKLHILSDGIPLKDDTFLLFETGKNIIIRFDKNLKTKFKPTAPTKLKNKIYIPYNFFILEYSTIEAFNKKFNGISVPRYQSIHDALLLHFHNQYKH